MKIDKTFANKIFIKEVPEESVGPLLKSLILNAWMDHDVLSEAMIVKANKKLTIEMLPKTFDVDNVVKETLRKGILMLDRIGPIMFNLRLYVYQTKQVYTLDIDKFAYENNGKSLGVIIDKALKDIGNG
jgi:hypothetical protein